MNFDRVAPFYQLLEKIAFGNALQRARVFWIGQMAGPTRVLIVGEGDGRFLREFVRAYPKIDIDCVDASARMQELARTRLQRDAPESLAQVRFHHADIRNWIPPHTYDLIVTHFFLDCFERDELERVITRIAAHSFAQATWLVSDFALPEKGFARAHAQLWLKTMYEFFGFTAGLETNKLVDPNPHFEMHGFLRRSTRGFRGGLLRASVYARD